MRSYIEETIELFGKHVKEYVVLAMQGLFNVMELKLNNVKFHFIITKLLYLRKRGRRFSMHQGKSTNCQRCPEAGENTWIFTAH